MTYLLLQTFLLLLSSYFLGAFLACVTKRTIMARGARMAAVTARTAATPVIAAPADIVPLAKPRDIDPVQPKIDILPRPTPKAVPLTADVDISRFDRALTGPEPNAGMPRKMIVEIRPAILKSPTGPAQPWKPKPAPVAAPKVDAPKPEASKSEALKAEAPKAAAPKTEASKPDTAKPGVVTSETGKGEPPKPEVANAAQIAAQTSAQPAAAQAAAPIDASGTQKTATVQSVPSTKSVADAPKKETPAPTPSSAASGMAAGVAGAAAAAAAAVAAAKAAAASVMPRPVTPAPQPTKPVVEAAPAPPVLTTVSMKSGDAPAPAKPAAVEAAPKPLDPQPAASQPASPVAAPAQPTPPQPEPSPTAPVAGGVDDLLRIRAIDTETERRLHGIGIRRFEDIARWTPADINRVNQALGLTGRIDREQWIEQAQILAKGGETYYSRNRAAAAAKASGALTPSAPAAAQAQSVTPAPSPAAQSAAPTQTAAAIAATPASATAPAIAPASSAPATPQSAASTANLQGKSVSEMAVAAAAAIAAASASVTRGIRPIEPISPLTRANPNIVMPAKLSDAIKEKDSKPAAPAAPAKEGSKDAAAPKVASGGAKADDLKRIRGIGVLIEKRLNALGVTTYGDVANWTSGDIDRISQTLDFKGRIERENWVEQARILSSGGHTEFSRRVDRGDVETSRDDD